MKKYFIISLLGCILLYSCYRDNEQDLNPVTSTCNLSGVTFQTTVAPLLQSNACISCHSGSAPSGNISLQGYANVRAAAMSGKLYGAINHGAGFSPMPKGGNKMNSCAIQQIKAWIDGGSVNN